MFVTIGTIASTEETYRYKMQIQSNNSPQTSPRSRTTSTSSAVSMSSVRSAKSSSLDTSLTQSSPATKTAGDIKAGLVHSINEGDLSEGQESLPSPNGNLRY